MKKITTIIATIWFSMLSINLANAGSFAVGATGSLIAIDARGTETDSSSTTKTTDVGNNAFVGSIFAEYSLNDVSWADSGNSITLGVSYIPGSADISDKTKSRTDIETSVTDDATENTTSRTQTAQAEIDNYRNFYIELPVWKSLYVKAGKTTIDVNTLDTTNGSNGGSYPNKSLDGTNYGLGFKGVTGSNILWKFSFEQTNYDTLNLTSTTDNTIKADLDTKEVNLSLGYRF